MTEKYLVYGGNGMQGGAVVRQLLAAGKRVRLLTRRPESVSFRADSRIEIVRGDLDDAASLVGPSTGVDGIYFMLPLELDAEILQRRGERAIDAAVAAKARHLVFNTTGIVPDAPVDIPMLDALHRVEQHLAKAHVPSITLRGTIYLGNLGAPWSAPHIVQRGVLAYPLPREMRVAWLSWEDAATFAVAALSRRDLAERKRTFQLGGAESLTGPELAAVIGRVLGRAVDYAALAPEDLATTLAAFLGPANAQSLARYYRWLAQPAQRGLLDVDAADARRELAVTPQPVQAWAREFPWTQLAGGAK